MPRLLLLTGLLCTVFAAISQPFNHEWIDYTKTYYKFGVPATRLVRIPYTTLTEAGLGNVPAEHFQLWRNGEEVPIYTSVATGILPKDGFLEFIGVRNDGKKDAELWDKPENQLQTELSYFNDTAYYFLTVNTSGNPLRIIQKENGVASTNLTPDAYYLHEFQENFFENWCFGSGTRFSNQAIRTAAFSAGEGYSMNPFNNWFPRLREYARMEVYRDGPQFFTINFTFTGNYPLTRNVNAYILDSLIASVPLTNFASKKTATLQIPLSKMRSDSLRMKFDSNNDYYWENVILNQFNLKYPRQFSLGFSQYFKLNLEANQQGNHLRLAKFTHANRPAIVYDATNQSRYLAPIKGDSILVLLEPSATRREIHFFAQTNQILTVTQLKPKKFVDFTEKANQGNYLIITNKVLRAGSEDAVAAYRDYRRSPEGGAYQANIYDIDELGDQFAFGHISHPYAIRKFVQFARAHFDTKPRMVFLVGKGINPTTFRLYGPGVGKYEFGLLPTLGLPSSDNLLVAESMANPTPLIPIGRLSAVNSQEVKNYLQKVKDYEILAANPLRKAVDAEWRKEVLQLIGGDDEFLAISVSLPFMRRYANIISDTPTSARVQTFLRVKNQDFAADMQKIKQRIDSGVNLITYFGHSSISSLDFNLIRPESFNTERGRYPFMIANGCKAGNIFDFNTTRSLTKNTSISENFVLAKNKGAIGFISNTDFGIPNYLDFFTLELYTALAKTAYGRPVGEAIRMAAKNCIDKVPLDFYNRANIEQVAYHGDPAVVLFPITQPDYTTDSSLITLSPAAPQVSNEMVNLAIPLINIGRAIRENVTVVVAQKLPSGVVRLLKTAVVANIFKRDSLLVTVPLEGLFEAGENEIIITIDGERKSQDVNFANNQTRVRFSLESLAAFPVFPYNLSIQNNPAFRLVASTADPTAKEQLYRVQIDTTRLFNSPLLETLDSTKIGGALTFYPAIKRIPNTVYYWRISPILNNLPLNWQNASFLFAENETPGYNQSHYFQHQESTLNQLSLAASSRKFEFGNKLHNLFVEHGIYPTSGTEGAHFSLTADGIRLASSACVGQSIVFNVFDGNSFAAWENLTGRFGSAAYCGIGKEHNFEFKYVHANERKQIMDFIHQIPKGDYVVARLILDPPQDSALASVWQRDTLQFGSGKSLYHTLKQQGFAELDSLNRPRTFAFVFKKDDSVHFKPLYEFSEGLYDRIAQSFNTYTQVDSGVIWSPIFGPSKKWNHLKWQSVLDSGSPTQLITVYGLTVAGNLVKLNEFTDAQGTVDLSNVDAAIYPNVQLSFNTREKEIPKPQQLLSWMVNFQPVADGALSAIDSYLPIADTLYAEVDSIFSNLAFKNVSDYTLPSTNFRVVMGSETAPEKTLSSGTIPVLQPQQFSNIPLQTSIRNLKGRYYLKIWVNQEKNPTEQHWFNNRAILPFVVDTLKNPFELADFKVSLGANKIAVNWNTRLEAKMSRYEVIYGTDSSNMTAIGNYLPVNNPRIPNAYQLDHSNPVFSTNYYRLKSVDNYGNSWLSAAKYIASSLEDFTITGVGSQIESHWRVQNEVAVKTYQLQWKQAEQWIEIGTLSAKNTGVSVQQYALNHLNPSLGENWYRLLISGTNNDISYSTPQKIAIQIGTLTGNINQFSFTANWSFTNEINLQRYELQQADASGNFSTVSNLDASNTGMGVKALSLTHLNTAPGNFQYRIKVTDKNGNVQYSNTVSVFVGDPSTVYLYPNPIKDFLYLVSGDPEPWSLRMVDATGKLVLTNAGMGSQRFNVSNLAQGVYWVQFKKGNLQKTFKLVKPSH